MTSAGSVDSSSTVTALAYGIPANNNTGRSTNPNALLAGVLTSEFKGELWFSSNVGSGGSPLARLPAYVLAGGQAPTSMVFDPTSPSAQSSPGQIRFYVADGTDLWGTRNQGTSIQKLTGNLPQGFMRPLAVEFMSNNGVNALLTGGLNIPLTVQLAIRTAASSAASKARLQLRTATPTATCRAGGRSGRACPTHKSADRILVRMSMCWQSPPMAGVPPCCTTSPATSRRRRRCSSGWRTTTRNPTHPS